MKFKHFIAFLLIFLPIVVSAEEIEIDGLWYNLIKKAKVAEVIQYKNNQVYSGELIIPSVVTFESIEYSVSTIREHAFSNCYDLTSVTIPNSVTTIGEGAFEYCCNLISISIPSSVTSISSNTFAWCSSLTSVTIPNSITTIGKNAFAYCGGLTSVTIPNSVTNIDDSSFQYCYGLTSVIIPNSVTFIGNYSFSGCTNLTSVTIPNSVTSIGNATFEGCSSLASLTIGNGVTSIGNSTFRSCNSLTSVNIPTSVTSIGNSSFAGCTNLASVTFPTSLTSIGNYAFSGCSALTSVNIPNSVMTIGSYVFEGCSGLTSLTIGSSVTSIGNYAFSGCSSLISLSIPSSLTSIGNYVFSGCSNLISLSIPSSVTSIGNNAFRGCSGLTSVTIPSSVKYIYDSAFEGCNNICKLIVGNGIRSIASRAFALCSNIEHVYCYAEVVPSTSTDAFEDSYINYATLHVPLSAIDSYKSVTPWSTFRTIKSYFPFVDPNVEALCVNNWDTNGDGELSEDEAAAVTDLGDVFKGNTTITSFNELQYFTGLTSIANNAFNGCTGLASVVIPSNVEVIGANAFTSTSITKIVIPDNVTIIGDGAFNGCSVLGSVTLSPALIIIGTSAFSSTPISKMVIPGNVTEIGNDAFANCTNLTVLTVGNSVTKIGASAFAGCTLLKTITIPSNVTTIGDNAFGLGTHTTTDLTSVIVKWTEPLTITENVFTNRANATLYVPADCKAKYETANYWKEFKMIVENNEVTSPFLVNAGFDEDLTFQVDGSKKEIIDQSNILSNRSIAGIAADNSVYALVNPSTPNHRPDGRTFEATNGFIGQVNGWENVNNQTFPKCEWVYFGTIPYDLQDQAIPIADDGSTYLEVPARPAVASGDNNVGFAYYRAGWGGRAVFKQTVNLPKAKYRLEYWAININPNGKNGKNLSKVTCHNDVWEDETGFNDQEWTLHTILFEADGETSIELGFESSGGSGSNPFLCIDCVELFNIGDPDINEVVQFVDEEGNCIEDGSIINITEGIEDAFGDIQFPTGLYVENLSDEDIYVGLSFNVISLPNGSFQIAFPVDCINYSRVGSGKTSEGLLAAGERRSLQTEWIPDVNGYGTCTVDLQINTYTYNSITNKYVLDKKGPLVTVNMVYSDGETPQPSTNTLSATSPTILTGNNSTLSFGLTNEDEIIMTEFYMQLPDGITIEEDEDGYPIVAINSERENKHVIEVNRNSEGLYHFLCYSSKNNAFKGNEGELFNMNLICAEGVTAGTYSATVKDIIMSDVDRNELTQSDFTFNISVMDVAMGDANGDGRINGMDIVEMVDYIMERPSNSFVFAAADLTGDGKVNGMDLVELVSLVMAQGATQAAPPSALPRREGTLQTEELDEGTLTLKGNENGGLMLGVENPDEFILAQMIVEVSDGTLTDVTTDAKHDAVWSQIGVGRYAVLAYSTRNRSFTTNDCLLTFLGCGNITVKDVMLVDADREAKFFADVIYNGTTGIESTPNSSLNGSESIYDLSGRKLETRNMELGTSPKGVYIVNGKKVVVK